MKSEGWRAEKQKLSVSGYVQNDCGEIITRLWD